MRRFGDVGESVKIAPKPQTSAIGWLRKDARKREGLAAMLGAEKARAPISSGLVR